MINLIQFRKQEYFTDQTLISPIDSKDNILLTNCTSNYPIESEGKITLEDSKCLNEVAAEEISLRDSTALKIFAIQNLFINKASVNTIIALGKALISFLDGGSLDANEASVSDSQLLKISASFLDLAESTVHEVLVFDACTITHCKIPKLLTTYVRKIEIIGSKINCLFVKNAYLIPGSKDPEFRINHAFRKREMNFLDYRNSSAPRKDYIYIIRLIKTQVEEIIFEDPLNWTIEYDVSSKIKKLSIK